MHALAHLERAIVYLQSNDEPHMAFGAQRLTERPTHRDNPNENHRNPKHLERNLKKQNYPAQLQNWNKCQSVCMTCM